MPRRDRSSPIPPPPSADSADRRGRLESVIPELIKRAILGGYDRASGAQESIKSFIADSKLPKEIVLAILHQMDDTKNGLFRVVAKEIRGFLEAIDFQTELRKLLTTVAFEIKTEIRFVPNESPEKLGRPHVKSDMKIKRSDREQRRSRGADKVDREGTEIDRTESVPSPKGDEPATSTDETAGKSPGEEL